MFATIRIHKKFFLILIIGTLFSPSILAQDKKKSAALSGVPVLWRDPGDISTRDLTYGPGSAKLAPAAPFTFVEEDKDGASPKFVVKDARNVTWSVKLGVESQAETVATRIVWAAGYFAEEAYFIKRATIRNLPRLSRGQDFVEGRSVVRGARFEPRRANVKRGPEWEWRENPFVGTRELDGLKVIMVLLANYDTSPANNRILSVNGEDRYVVTDIGATLGRVGGLGGKRTKNDLEDFQTSKFVVGVENGMVEFDYKTSPKGIGIFAGILNPGYGKSQAEKEKAMRRIPVENVRWIGTMLSGLRDDQLRAAFRAAGYNKATMEGFVKTLRTRIGQLARLSESNIGAVVR